MRVEFAATVAKDPAAEEFNEDRYLFSLDGCIASLSDGASESFDSKSWAEILCRLACSDSGINAETISDAAVEYSAQYDPTTLPWSKAAALERGSFATLLFVRQNSSRPEVELFAIGDTVVLLCESEEVVRKFPLVEPEEFLLRPTLLSTKNSSNSFLKDASFNATHVAVAPIGPGTVALLLTDALGHWCYQALRNFTDDWRILLTLNTTEDFHDFVLTARANGQLKIDDTTLIRLTF
jgi:hypothetical protein